MSRTRLLSSVIGLSIVAAVACGEGDRQTLDAARWLPAGVPAAGESVMLIEHRGRFYRVEDLTDPAFVAQSDDPFVKGFSANRGIAIQWAGMDANPVDSIPVEPSIMFPPARVEYSLNSDTFEYRQTAD